MMGEKSSETAIEDDGKGRGKKPSHTSIKMAQSEHTATEHVVQKYSRGISCVEQYCRYHHQI
jgi:hypothetical protein